MESYDDHRKRDEETIGLALLAAYFFPSLRGWIVFAALLMAGVWGINILGESTIFNSPDIYYSGIDARTGKQTIVQGCRPERLKPDGSCDKSISIDTIRKAFPFLGSAR